MKKSGSLRGRIDAVRMLIWHASPRFGGSLVEVLGGISVGVMSSAFGAFHLSAAEDGRTPVDRFCGRYAARPSVVQEHWDSLESRKALS